jgi:hypothetical protein
MSQSLTIITPGGVAMAPEEIFALISHCHRIRHTIEESVSRLRPFASIVPALPLALGYLQRAADQCDYLAKRLDELARETASQESWRQKRLLTVRDNFAWLAVAGSAWGASGKGGAWAQSMTVGSGNTRKPRSTLRGSQPQAVFDDAAAVLLGNEARPHGSRVIPVRRLDGVTPALTMADRIARIPQPGTPVRIETYRGTDGSTHADVFIAGTNQWSVGTGDSPFDMESNLALVAGFDASSVSATTQAMRRAGISPGDSVSFTGHSQGGLVAATLAESGVYVTRSLVTVGAPTSTVPIRGDYPALIIEHSNDVVTGLGGARVTTGATVVSRDSGHGRLDIYGAHSQDGYVETAALIDKSAGVDLADFAATPPAATGTAHVFSAKRFRTPRLRG